MCTTAFLASLFGISYIIFTVQHGRQVGDINLISGARSGSGVLQYNRVSHANFGRWLGNSAILSLNLPLNS